MRRRPIDWSAVLRKLYTDYGWTYETVLRMPWTAVFDALGWTADRDQRPQGTKSSFANLAAQAGLRQRKLLERALGGG